MLEKYGLSHAAYKDPDRASAENRWHQDREAMRCGETFSGIHSLGAEDAILTTSVGPLFDRTKEHLIPADIPIIRMRSIYFASIKRVERGEDPIGIDSEIDYGSITGRSGLIEDANNWADLIPEHTRRK